MARWLCPVRWKMARVLGTDLTTIALDVRYYPFYDSKLWIEDLVDVVVMCSDWSSDSGGFALCALSGTRRNYN